MRIKQLPARFRTTKSHTGHKRAESRTAADFWPIVMALSTDGHQGYSRMKNGRSLFVSGRDGAPCAATQSADIGAGYSLLSIRLLDLSGEVNSRRKKHKSATIVADR